MTTYQCINCKKEFELNDKKVRCIHCGYRILIKTRPKFKKRVMAR